MKLTSRTAREGRHLGKLYTGRERHLFTKVALEGGSGRCSGEGRQESRKLSIRGWGHHPHPHHRELKKTAPKIVMKKIFGRLAIPINKTIKKLKWSNHGYMERKLQGIEPEESVMEGPLRHHLTGSELPFSKQLTPETEKERKLEKSRVRSFSTTSW